MAWTLGGIEYDSDTVLLVSKGNQDVDGAPSPPDPRKYVHHEETATHWRVSPVIQPAPSLDTAPSQGRHR